MIRDMGDRPAAEDVDAFDRIHKSRVLRHTLHLPIHLVDFNLIRAMTVGILACFLFSAILAVNLLDYLAFHADDPVFLLGFHGANLDDSPLLVKRKSQLSEKLKPAVSQHFLGSMASRAIPMVLDPVFDEIISPYFLASPAGAAVSRPSLLVFTPFG